MPVPGKKNSADLVKAAGAVRQRRRVILLGDSITEQNRGPGTGNARVRANYGWFNYLNAMHRSGLDMRANYGVAGQTMTTLLQRIKNGEIAFDDADVVLWIMSGNGINQAVETTNLQVRSLISEIVNRIRDFGVPIVAGNIPPRTTSGSEGFETDAERSLVSAANEHLWKLSTDDPNVIAVDVWSRLADSTGNPLAGVTYDAVPVHPGATGAYLIAQEFYRSTRSVLPVGGYPLYTGNLITVDLASWVSSEIAGTWGTKTTTHNVAGTDGRSDWTQVVLATPSAAGAVLQLAISPISLGSSTFEIGDTLQCALEVEIAECVDMRAVNMQGTLAGLGVSMETMGEYALASANSGLNISSARPMTDTVFSSPEVALTTGATGVQPKIRFSANSTSSSATIRVRNRPYLRNVSKLRI